MKENTKNPGSQNQENSKNDWDSQSNSGNKSNAQGSEKEGREKAGKTGLQSDSRLETTSAQSPNRKVAGQDENLKPHTTGKEKRDNDMPRSNEKNSQDKTNRTGNADTGRNAHR